MLGAIFLLAAAVSLPPKPDHYVTDGAGVLDATRAAALNEKLAAFERQSSDQILVYVGRSIPNDTTLEEYVNLAFREWGIGQKGKNNGAALFLFIDDRKMRIEVGYGLEGALTDARSSRIIKRDAETAPARGTLRRCGRSGCGRHDVGRSRRAVQRRRNDGGGNAVRHKSHALPVAPFPRRDRVSSALDPRARDSRPRPSGHVWLGRIIVVRLVGQQLVVIIVVVRFVLVVLVGFFVVLQRGRRRQRWRRRERIVVITRDAAPRPDRDAPRVMPG
jgi:hypothetical protein